MKKRRSSGIIDRSTRKTSIFEQHCFKLLDFAVLNMDRRLDPFLALGCIHLLFWLVALLTSATASILTRHPRINFFIGDCASLRRSRWYNASNGKSFPWVPR